MNAERKDRLDPRAVVLLLGCCATWGLAQVAVKISPTIDDTGRTIGTCEVLCECGEAERAYNCDDCNHEREI